jgi:hypothetical protein
MTWRGAVANVVRMKRLRAVAWSPRPERTILRAGAVLACLAMAACGNDASPRSHYSPFQTTCAATGRSLQISAHNVRYDRTCLAVQANVPFTITFANRDPGIRHNLAIFSGSRMYSQNSPTLFRGAVVTGPTTVVYHVPPLPPGTGYTFHCDVHADEMFGVFLVTGSNPSA